MPKPIEFPLSICTEFGGVIRDGKGYSILFFEEVSDSTEGTAERLVGAANAYHRVAKLIADRDKALADVMAYDEASFERQTSTEDFLRRLIDDIKKEVIAV